MTRADLAPLLEVAVAAASAEARVVVSSHGAREAGHKGLPGDYVTEVDRASETAILQVLRAEAGKIPVLAEERGGRTAERFWAVDPLDGTTNYLHRFPLVGVCGAGGTGAGRPGRGGVAVPGGDLRREPGPGG